MDRPRLFAVSESDVAITGNGLTWRADLSAGRTRLLNAAVQDDAMPFQTQHK